MASSAFGFARAVETLPNYFEFGKSLVGQGEADRALEQRNKELSSRLGLQAQEQADLNDYRTSELAQKRYEADQLDRYRTGMLAAEGAQNKIRERQIANLEHLAPSQIGQNLADANARNAQANSTTQLIEPTRQHLASESTRNLATGRNLDSEAAAREAENQRQKDYSQMNLYMNKYWMNPQDASIPEETRQQIEALYPVMMNPHAGPAHDLITNRLAAQQRGEPYVPPTEEENATIGRGIQPYLDMGGEGQQFLGFEASPDGQRVKVKLKNADGKEVYMTHNRLPNAQGGVDEEFTRQELDDLMGITKDAQLFHRAHPEFIQDIRDRQDAGSPENYWKGKLAAYRLDAKAQGKPESMADENFIRNWQKDFSKSLSLEIDHLTGHAAAKDAAKSAFEPFDDSAYQGEKEKLIAELQDAVRQHTKSPGDLTNFSSASVLDGVKDRVRALKQALPNGQPQGSTRPRAGSTFDNR